ncbi:hypothetical Protein YC6258_01909 [Gynuella sunshinyii YC6258]|uniref:Uncharacterized protein n=1 Tax=Gynuella sunshinyii YC6258 TaxID=1445510 RepID=A0A0C5VKM1_9GAMM|nr:hypothetical Protein YC6258_01909 [Gynuella sunshinyii YC6258]
MAAFHVAGFHTGGRNIRQYGEFLSVAVCHVGLSPLQHDLRWHCHEEGIHRDVFALIKTHKNQ